MNDNTPNAGAVVALFEKTKRGEPVTHADLVVTLGIACATIRHLLGAGAVMDQGIRELEAELASVKAERDALRARLEASADV